MRSQTEFIDKKKTELFLTSFSVKISGHFFSVDATAESGLKGRLLNHSRTAPNAEPKVIEMDDGTARLAFFAIETILPGLELQLISAPLSWESQLCPAFTLMDFFNCCRS